MADADRRVLLNRANNTIRLGIIRLAIGRSTLPYCEVYLELKLYFYIYLLLTKKCILDLIA